ncbi:MAG: (2Fe-2S) ferredoxin domain-containing protein [Ignavibacteriae bacterium]|nr:MAG: (2Fe-2S) ferredoxin domain-containing protein [Ignavibacteriota bacterium]
MASKISIEDLAKIRKETLRTMNLREGSGKVKMNVHMGTCGIAAGARKILEAVLSEVETRGLNDIIVTNSGCAGLCSQEPMMTVEVYNEPAPVKYVSLTPEKVKKIFDSHVLKGEIVKEYALALGSETTV